MNTQLVQSYKKEYASVIEQSGDCPKTVISAVIRVRNAADDLKKCLSGLKEQDISNRYKLEIIVVDNESTDNSADIARDYGAIVVSIPKHEFSWGRALNRGISHTTGDVVIIISSDARPVNKNWLGKMIEILSDDKVAAAYCRQVPYRNAPVDERVRLEKYFGQEGKCFDQRCPGISPAGKGMIVSNASAVIRKSIWSEVPYDEEIEAGEEGLWSYLVLQKGYKIIYCADAEVYHSHNDDAFRMAWRQWELEKKNAALNKKKINRAGILRCLASFSKRRISNCARFNVPLRSRAAGLVHLPWELIALAVVGFYSIK